MGEYQRLRSLAVKLRVDLHQAKVEGASFEDQIELINQLTAVGTRMLELERI